MTPSSQEEPFKRAPQNGSRGAEDRSIGELFTDLANDTGTLLRQEIKLASTELSQKATFAGRQIAFIAVGLLVGVVGLLALVGALVLGLATVIPLWKSALTVGLAFAVIAILVVWKGAASLRDMKLAPRQTLLSIQEDKQWLEQKAR